MECLTCKKHYSQGGYCYEKKKNCLFYEDEPRGKVLRTDFTFKMNCNAETPVIKYGSKLLITENCKDIVITVIKINWINMETFLCNVDANYYENEQPRCEKIKKFKVVN